MFLVQEEQETSSHSTETYRGCGVKFILLVASAHLSLMWSILHLTAFPFRIQKDRYPFLIHWVTEAPLAVIKPPTFATEDKHTNHFPTQAPFLRQKEIKAKTKTNKTKKTQKLVSQFHSLSNLDPVSGYQHYSIQDQASGHSWLRILKIWTSHVTRQVVSDNMFRYGLAAVLPDLNYLH